MAATPTFCLAGMVPIGFEPLTKSAPSDPQDVWSDAEIAESESYTRQWIVSAEAAGVAGSSFIVSILFGDLCTLQTCPMRLVHRQADGSQERLIPAKDGEFEYEQVCQSLEDFAIDIEARILAACGDQFQF